MFTWLKNLLAKIPAPIEKALWALVVATLTYFAAQQGIVIPAPVINNFDNYVGLDVTPPSFEAAQGPRLNPLLGAVARIKAARQYAKENPSFSFQMAHTLMCAIPDSEVIAEAKKHGFQATPDVSGGRLSDWLDAHPDFIANLVKLFLILAPLFAHADVPPDIAPWEQLNFHAMAPRPPPYPVC